jgi:hypothetical protein
MYTWLVLLETIMIYTKYIVLNHQLIRDCLNCEDDFEMQMNGYIQSEG